MTTQTCPRCQARFEAQSGVDTCPACLLEAGLDPPGAATVPTSGTERFQSPALETLAKQFPQLEFRSLLGTGGMGAVYLARQKSLDRAVAIKILPAEIARDPAFAERFQREARTLARLNHPNIVTIFESGQVGPWCYLLMEYVDGITLRQAISDGGLAPKDSLEVVRQLCDALQYAHEMGVVHRDIKPENVLLDARGRIKIADFGLAKLVGGERGDFTLTRSHQVMGTWHYMAPEQFERPSDVDHRADLYSLGVVFYELLTGHLPVGRFEPPSERARVDASIDAVVLRALERQPQKRYQRASELREALERVPSAAGPAAAKPTPQGAFAAAAKDAVPPGKPAATSSSNSRRLPPLPFRIRNDYGDLATGLTRIRPEHLEIEFRTHWAAIWQDWTALWHDYGHNKPGLHTLNIPWESICEIKLVQGWFGSRIEIRLDSVALASSIPGNAQGCFFLNIAKADFDLAKTFVREAISKLQLPEPLEEPAPDHRAVVRSEIPSTESDSFAPDFDLIGWSWVALALLQLLLVLSFRDHGVQFGPKELLSLIAGQVGFAFLAAWSHLTRASRVLSAIGMAVASFPTNMLFPFYLPLAIASVVTKRGLRDPGYAIHLQQQPRLLERLFLLTPINAASRLALCDRRIRPAGMVAGLVGIAGIGLTVASVFGQSKYGWNSSPDAVAPEFEIADGMLITNSIALLIAGFLLTRRQHWEACLIASLVAMLPLSFSSLLIAPFAIWLLVLLSQRQVRDAFAITELEPNSQPSPAWNLPPGGKSPLPASPSEPVLRSGIDIPPRLKEFSPPGKPDALSPTLVNKFQTVAPTSTSEIAPVAQRKLARWPLALIFLLDVFAIPFLALFLIMPVERSSHFTSDPTLAPQSRFEGELREKVDEVRRSLRNDLRRAGIEPMEGHLESVDEAEESGADTEAHDATVIVVDSHTPLAGEAIEIHLAFIIFSTVVPHSLLIMTSLVGLIASLFWRGGWLHRMAAYLSALPIHIGCLVGIPWAIARQFSRES